MMHRHTSARRLQAGLSLVELMIGMVLGLIVVAAVFNIYAGSSRSARFSEGLQSMQENGRYGVSVLQRGLRLAGYSPTGRLSPLDMDRSSRTQITVRQIQAFDCNGAATTDTDGLAVNTYRYDAPGNQITCTGNQTGATAMPIVEGVDGFSILYGIDDADDDFSVPQRYISYDAAIDPDTVSAVRFAMLVTSSAPIRSRSVEETHVLLDTSVKRTDRMARNVYSSTVMLRNRPTN